MSGRPGARAANVLRVLSGGAGTSAIRKVVSVLRRDGFGSVLVQARKLWHASAPRTVPGEPGVDRGDYQEWIRRHDTLGEGDRQRLLAAASSLAYRPVVSIIMPTYNSRGEWLREAVDSLRAQLYDRWELCIADDASPKPHVRSLLEELCSEDPRIKVHFRPVNGHICAASNDALAMATGEWILLLDHDDVLPPHALLHVVAALNRHRDARLVYTDEDKLGPGGRFEPYMKPDWNPDLFRSQNMFSHLGVIHAGLAREVGGFRPGLEGSQDYDLVLRCVERVQPHQVLHIPKVLYHWRVHEESTSRSVSAKPYAQIAAVRALQEHCDRVGMDAQVSATAFGYRTIYALPAPEPEVLLVLRGAADWTHRRLTRTVQRIRTGTAYPHFRIVVVGAEAGDGWTSVRELDPDALRASCGSSPAVICLLDAAWRPADDGWLTELVRQALRPDIGLVGPMVCDRSGRILSAGVVLTPGENGRFRGVDAHAGLPSTAAGHGGRAQRVQRFSAVRDGCVAMRLTVLGELPREVFAAPDGGLALSAEVRRRGLGVLWTPYSRVRTTRSELQSTPLGECRLESCSDPAYSPNLFAAGDFTLAWPPLPAPVLA